MCRRQGVKETLLKENIQVVISRLLILHGILQIFTCDSPSFLGKGMLCFELRKEKLLEMKIEE